MMPKIRQQLSEVRTLLVGATGDSKDEARAMERKLLSMLAEHKTRLLEVGAAGRLLIAGDLDAVLPLEEANAFKNADPVTPTGDIQFDPQAVEARHDAQVRTVTGAALVAVIILGGEHDLTASVQRLGNGEIEYVRVTTEKYAEIAKLQADPVE